MQKMITLSLITVVSVFMLFACKRERVVHAGNEPGQSDAYQPRQPESADNSKKSADTKASKALEHKLVGELIKVDVPNNLITVRTDSGMEQTFKLDNTTLVNGAAAPGKAKAPVNNKSIVKNLAGKEGEILVVEFEDPSGPKLALSVDVK